MFHLFCPRLYAGFKRDKTKGASNKELYVSTFIGITRKWCVSQSRASELKGNPDILSLGSTSKV